MSNTIERAMQQASGEAAAPADAERERSVATVSAPNKDRVISSPPKTEPARAQSVPAAPNNDERRGAEGRVRGSVIDADEVGLHIDLDYLASCNFLVPGRSEGHLADQIQHIKRRVLGNIITGSTPSGRPPNLIMITSAVPGEGKTFTSINLALSLAMEMDRSILAVDTDIAKSDMTRILGAIGKPGLFDVLSNPGISIGDVMLRTNVPKLSFIPAGTIHGSVSEKLASEAMGRLTDELASRYPDRVVLFDCPPILATTGAGALAPYIGQVLMVVEAWRTAQGTIKHALSLMDNTTITGMILNKTRESSPVGSYYYYKYGYGYGAKS